MAILKAVSQEVEASAKQSFDHEIKLYLSSSLNKHAINQATSSNASSSSNNTPSIVPVEKLTSQQEKNAIKLQCALDVCNQLIPFKN